MNQHLQLTSLKFIFLFTGCILLGMALGMVLTAMAAFLMQHVSPWYGLVTNVAINHLCIYLIPPLVYWHWFESASWKGFSKRPLKSVSVLWAGIFVGITFLPFNEILIGWNKGITLPKAFSTVEHWMIQKEQANQLLVAKLTAIESFDQLITLLVVSALIASVGEEVFFRGIIQNKLIQGTKNNHLGIWLTAALFSAVHLQFYGFFPRLALGAIFGYLYVFSGNLWVPILVHFINNSLFILSFFFKDQVVLHNLEVQFPNYSWLYGSSSLILSMLLILYFRRSQFR